MNEQELLAYAEKIAAGGKIKADEVRAFMRAVVEQHTADLAEAPPDVEMTQIGHDEYAPVDANGNVADEPRAHTLTAKERIALDRLAPSSNARAGNPAKCTVPVDRLPNGGIHLSREVNRAYTPQEARDLIAKIDLVLGA